MEDRLKEVLAFANNKGGVGKTTTVHNVAAALLRRNKKNRVLCIDMDAQCSLSTLLGWNAEQKRHELPCPTLSDAMRTCSELPVYKAKDGLYYVPSSPDLAFIEPDLYRQMNSKAVLYKLLGKPLRYYRSDNGTEKIEDAASDFDYILIDCAPEVSELTYNALCAASGMVVPMELSALSLDGIIRMLEIYKQVRGEYSDFRFRGILIAKAESRTRMSKKLLEGLKTDFGGILFKSQIRQCTKVRECQDYRQDIFTYAPSSTAAEDYDAFTSELIRTAKVDLDDNINNIINA